MPLLYFEKNNNSFVWGIWRISEEVSMLKDALGEEKAEWHGFQATGTKLKQCQFLAARILLNELLGPLAKVYYDANGKPYSTSGHGISISHSKDLVAVMAANGNRVGVDIEKIPRPRLKQGASFYLSIKERQEIDDTLLMYHLYWSAKEAAFKALGNPTLTLQSIYITPFQLEQSGETYASDELCLNLLKIKYVVCDDFVVVWATD